MYGKTTTTTETAERTAARTMVFGACLVLIHAVDAGSQKLVESLLALDEVSKLVGPPLPHQSQNSRTLLGEDVDR